MKNFRNGVIALGLSSLMLGCGGNGASNNDQGISVSFLGLFQTATSDSDGDGTSQSNLTGCGQLPQPLASGFLSIGQTFLRRIGTTVHRSNYICWAELKLRSIRPDYIWEG